MFLWARIYCNGMKRSIEVGGEKRQIWGVSSFNQDLDWWEVYDLSRSGKEADYEYIFSFIAFRSHTSGADSGFQLGVGAGLLKNQGQISQTLSVEEASESVGGGGMPSFVKKKLAENRYIIIVPPIVLQCV